MSRAERIAKVVFAPVRAMPVRMRGLFVLVVMLTLFPAPFVLAFSRAFSYSAGGTVQERYADWTAGFLKALRCVLTGKLQ